MKAKVWAEGTLTLLIPLLAGIVLLAGLSISERLIQHGWQATLVFSDVIGLTAALIGVLTLLWWLLAITGAFLATLLSRLGRYRAATIVSALSPAFMRRMATGVLGLELAAAGVLGGAGVIVAPAPAFAAVAAADTTDPSFHLSEPSAPDPSPAPSAAPSPTSTPQPSPNGSSVHPGWTPQPPATDIDVVAAPAHRSLSPKESKGPGQPGVQTPLAQPGPASKPAAPGTGSATAPSSTMNHIV
ncbi:MAG: hypothetical protein HIU81_08020, partial [Acidobacteria bacterium]|nr:hypothetical protein [Acidobacteriota bacterium]